MKIIELLNKIANGEEVPFEIKCCNKIYRYDNLSTDYEQMGGFNSLFKDLLILKHCSDLPKSLNDEVEILEEEKKIPEKLEDISEIKCVGCKVEINIAGNKTLFDTDTPIVTEHCIYKINQLIKNQKKIIDYLKSKGE